MKSVDENGVSKAWSAGAGLMPLPAAGGTGVRSARSVLTGNSFSTATGLIDLPAFGGKHAPDFCSDVGRKQFGFSHEEIEDTSGYYEGQFRLYQRSGRGVLQFPDTGAKYVGDFQNDQFHGEGDQTWPDGSRYVGQWRFDQKHGKGEYVSASGLRYEGTWEKGRRHGLGVQVYANGDTYRGSWYYGLCSGMGTYTFADGTRYEGTWTSGRHDGTGVFYGAGGSRERQWYTNGLLTRREVLPNGPPPKPGSRRDFAGGRVVFNQTRTEMEQPARLASATPSKYLIRRETADINLSAPPLKPKTAPARMDAGPGLDDDRDGGRLPAPPPSTAPARVQGGSLDD